MIILNFENEYDTRCERAPPVKERGQGIVIRSVFGLSVHITTKQKCYFFTQGGV